MLFVIDIVQCFDYHVTILQQRGRGREGEGRKERGERGREKEGGREREGGREGERGRIIREEREGMCIAGQVILKNFLKMSYIVHVISACTQNIV